MRRTTLLVPLLGIVLAVPGCVGFNDYFDNTHTLGSNPHMPLGDGPNMRRVQGQTSDITPIAPEPGNVWPRSVEPLPSLQNIDPDRGGQPRSSSIPRPTQSSGLPINAAPAAMAQPSFQATPPSPLTAAPAPPQTVIPTTTGAAIVTTGTDRYQTVNTPTGTAVVVPNGNGTATLMRADGTMEVVTVPR